jgi:hypothetical protein
LSAGSKSRCSEPVGDRPRAAPDGQRLVERQERVVLLVELADDARAHIGAPVEQLLLDLVLDDLAALLDDQHLFEPLGEMADALGSSGQGMRTL